MPIRPDPNAAPAALSSSVHHWARDASNESAVIQASCALGIFDCLARHGQGAPRSVSEIASEIGTSPRGTRVVMELLTCLTICRSSGDPPRYSLSPSHADALRTPALGAALRNAKGWWRPAELLPEALRTGGTVAADGQSRDVLAYFREWLLAEPPLSMSTQESLIDRGIRGFLRTQMLITAAGVGLLGALAIRPERAGTFARALGLHPEGAGLMLALLARHGMVVALEDGTYASSEQAVPLLEAKALDYLKKSLSVSSRYWTALRMLDETVRSGRVFLDLKDPEESRRFYADNSDQITAVFASHFRMSRRAASTLASVFPLEGASVLDVGTGSGVWGTAFARAAPRVQVTYFDQPAVIERVRSNVERMGVGAQARYLSEDLFTHAFEAHAFDVVILPQVLNVLRPEDVPGLLARVARALRPGGVLVIAEYVLDEGRHGPLGHLYFGLRRFITNEGDLFSASEYAELLRAAGLPHARCFSLGSQEVIFGARSDVALPLQLVPEA